MYFGPEHLTFRGGGTEPQAAGGLWSKPTGWYASPFLELPIATPLPLNPGPTDQLKSF